MIILLQQTIMHLYLQIFRCINNSYSEEIYSLATNIWAILVWGNNTFLSTNTVATATWSTFLSVASINICKHICIERKNMWFIAQYGRHLVGVNRYSTIVRGSRKCDVLVRWKAFKLLFVYSKDGLVIPRALRLTKNSLLYLIMGEDRGWGGVRRRKRGWERLGRVTGWR